MRREDYEAIPGEREDSGQDQKGSGEREDSRQDLERLVAVVRSRYEIMTMVHLDTGMCDRVYLNQTERPGRVNTGDYDYYIQRAAEGVVHEADRERFLNTFGLANLRRRAEDVQKTQEEDRKSVV